MTAEASPPFGVVLIRSPMPVLAQQAAEHWNFGEKLYGADDSLNVSTNPAVHPQNHPLG
jgi:hypothetical protein